MKRIITILSLIFFAAAAHAQTAGESFIVGNWKTEDDSAKIQIYKTTSGHYAGKIVWMRQPIDVTTGQPKLDKFNPDPKLRTRPRLNLVMVYNFKYNAAEDEWEGGTLYNPKDGKSYKCKINKIDANTIKVRSYIGFTFIGKSTTWKRAKD